jgi:hypothetical protein
MTATKEDGVSTESTFYPGRTLDEVAREKAEALVGQVAAGAVNEETPHSRRALRLEVFMLAVGGPQVTVEFVVDTECDDEVLSGVVEYREASGGGRWELPLTEAMHLYDALHTPVGA